MARLNRLTRLTRLNRLTRLMRLPKLSTGQYPARTRLAARLKPGSTGQMQTCIHIGRCVLLFVLRAILPDAQSGKSLLHFGGACYLRCL